MAKGRTDWRGFFRARDPATGLLIVENDIQATGIEMVMKLWNADTTERFDALRLEDAGNATIATEPASRSFTVDTSIPRGEFKSVALFSSGQVGNDVEFVSLIGSAGTVIATAALSLAAGSAYEIERLDYLGESSAVLPT
jgi:hypothetical protein